MDRAVVEKDDITGFDLDWCGSFDFVVFEDFAFVSAV